MMIDGNHSVPPRLEKGWVSPSYGVKVPTHVVVLQAEANLPVSLRCVFADTRLSAGERQAAIDELEPRSTLA
jgi:hypothetical protein